MKLTNVTAFNCVQMMDGMKETGKLGYAIAKNMRKLRDELVEYNQKRDELIMKYGEPSDGAYIVQNEKVPEFLKELSEYNNIEFEFYPVLVTADEFCSGGLTSDQMYALDWMVSED